MRTKSLLPIDEINKLKTYLEGSLTDPRVSKDDIEDTILDILIMSYMYGTDSTNLDLNTNINPSLSKMDASINKMIEGMTWDMRVADYIAVAKSKEDSKEDTMLLFDDDEDVSEILTDLVNKINEVDEIMRVVNTEAHRVYVEAQYDAAIASGLNVKKEWVTMLDDRVRDTHNLLEGVKIDLLEEFHTIDGDKALYPGDFELASNNINCRCELKLSTE